MFDEDILSRLSALENEVEGLTKILDSFINREVLVDERLKIIIDEIIKNNENIINELNDNYENF